MSYDIITILGPTAVGKTRLAVMLANEFNGEIISADSRQVYKGMDVGTGKDLDDYIIDGKKIPYHLIDVISPSEEFNLYRFNEHFYKAFHKIRIKQKLPFLVGGTGLYLHSILKQYQLPKSDLHSTRYKELNELPIKELREMLLNLNPKLHNTTDLLIKERVIRAIIIANTEAPSPNEPIPSLNSLVIGVRLERKLIKQRITNRLKQRLQNGMIEEVKGLLDKGLTYKKLYFFGLEYKFIGQYLKGDLNYNDMFQKLNSAIHNFAKRQMTWYRKTEKEGIKIHWLNGPDFQAAKKYIINNISLNK